MVSFIFGRASSFVSSQLGTFQARPLPHESHLELGRDVGTGFPKVVRVIGPLRASASFLSTVGLQAKGILLGDSDSHLPISTQGLRVWVGFGSRD